MSTQFDGLKISAVALATGLERADIYRAQELAQMGVPRHFIYIESEQVYTGEGVGELVQGLEKLGKTMEARALAAALSQRRAQAAGRGFGGWLLRHEQRQEGAAA